MTVEVKEQARDAEARIHMTEPGAVKESRMESQQTPPISPSLSDPRQARMLFLLAGLLGAAIVAFLIVWLAGRDGSKPVSVPAQGGPTAVSEAQLQKLASTVKHPVYWAGSKHGAYELTRMS